MNATWYTVSCGRNEVHWLAFGVQTEICDECGAADCRVRPDDDADYEL